MTQEDQEENVQADKAVFQPNLCDTQKGHQAVTFLFNLKSQKESQGEVPQTGFYSLYWPVFVTGFELFNTLLIIHFGDVVSLSKAFKNINNNDLTTAMC